MVSMKNDDRRILLVFILLAISIQVIGQNFKKWEKDTHYEAMIEMTNSLSFSQNSANIFAIETVHGITKESIGFFMGIGVGFYSKGYWPILSKMRNLGRENFNLEYIHRYNLSLSVEGQYRMNNIRKLRKVFKPFISFKIFYLVHKHPYDNITVYLNRESASPLDVVPLDYNDGGIEIAIGGEFVIKHFPRIYCSLGYEFFSNSSIESDIVTKNDNSEEVHYEFKLSTPKSLNFKIGIRL